MNPEQSPDLKESPVTTPPPGDAAGRSAESSSEEPRLRPGEKADLERQIAGRTGWIYTVDINTPEGVRLAKEQEHLFLVWADRRERDAEARKAEHEATKAQHEARLAAHRTTDEPRRLQMQHRREEIFGTVLLLVTTAGVAMVVGGVVINPILFPAAAATLSGVGGTAFVGLRRPSGPARSEEELPP
ncbi:MAG TPA: hypothetical protein VMR96_00795 [Solirubrobacterales bacterium]|nr:hypothetical protein [Solirubrobacterales bacterium]